MEKLPESPGSSAKRIVWVDVGKFICCTFVLFSHMEYVPQVMRCLFKPFFLTTFFFLTGYVFNTKRPFREFLRLRVRTLLLPALLFSILYLLDMREILKGTYSLPAIAEDLSVLLRQQRGQGDMLWFLYVSFLAQIPLFFICKYLGKKTGLLISAVLCEASILFVQHWMTDVPYWYIHIIFVAMFLMVCGYWYRRQEADFKMLENKKVIGGIAVFYMAVTLVGYGKFGVFFNINEYGASSLLWYAVVFCGVILVVFISKRLPSNGFIRFMGSNTVLFYLFHDRVRQVYNLAVRHMDMWDQVQHSIGLQFVCSFGAYIFEVIMLSIISYLVIRYAPFIVGRNRLK